mgnify:CR=1 FL=1
MAASCFGMRPQLLARWRIVISPTPAIRKAQLIQGKTLSFRDASIDDAEFILSLRTHQKKSRYLSKVTPELASQREWLEIYQHSSHQAYFIIEHQAEPIGTVRLYDPHWPSFCWGSWVLSDGAPSTASIESALMVYTYAVDHLGFTAAHFDVRKGNESVWRFHERFGAVRISEGVSDYFYQIDLSAIEASRKRYEKFLPNGVAVEF